MMPFRIEHLTPAQDGELTDFLNGLSAYPAGPMVLGYHYPENRDMLLRVLHSGTRPVYLAARDVQTGNLRAVLPGMLQQTDGMACYNSLPFFGPNGGVLAASTDVGEYGALSGALTAAALEYARERGAVTATFYSAFNPTATPTPNPALDGLSRSLVRIAKRTLYSDLPVGQAPHWPSAARRNILKAERAGMMVRIHPLTPFEVESLFALYVQNCRQRDIPQKPRACIEYLCSPAYDARVGKYLAYLDGQIVAGLLTLFGAQTVSYYLPCLHPDYASLQPLPFLIHQASQDAVRRGMKFWNWESSPGINGGVYRFKKKWNAHPLDYEIVVVSLKDAGLLRALGADRLAALFPYYFVYPYDRL